MIFYAVLLILNQSMASDVSNAFENYKIVPDIVPSAPECLLQVTYHEDLQVSLGANVSSADAVLPPSIQWDACDDKYYTLIMLDPDAISQENPTQQWLVANIPGQDVASGETLGSYLSAMPAAGAPTHRYIFLVYEQTGKLDFNGFQIPGVTYDNRLYFDVNGFIEKYGLGVPVAGNFFIGYIPVLSDAKETLPFFG